MGAPHNRKPPPPITRRTHRKGNAAVRRRTKARGSGTPRVNNKSDMKSRKRRGLRKNTQQKR